MESSKNESVEIDSETYKPRLTKGSTATASNETRAPKVHIWTPHFHVDPKSVGDLAAALHKVVMEFVGDAQGVQEKYQFYSKSAIDKYGTSEMTFAEYSEYVKNIAETRFPPDESNLHRRQNMITTDLVKGLVLIYKQKESLKEFELSTHLQEVLNLLILRNASKLHIASTQVVTAHDAHLVKFDYKECLNVKRCQTPGITLSKSLAYYRDAFLMWSSRSEPITEDQFDNFMRDIAQRHSVATTELVPCYTKLHRLQQSVHDMSRKINSLDHYVHHRGHNHQHASGAPAAHSKTPEMDLRNQAAFEEKDSTGRYLVKKDYRKYFDWDHQGHWLRVKPAYLSPNGKFTFLGSIVPPRRRKLY